MLEEQNKTPLSITCQVHLAQKSFSVLKNVSLRKKQNKTKNKKTNLKQLFLCIRTAELICKPIFWISCYDPTGKKQSFVDSEFKAETRESTVKED